MSSARAPTIAVPAQAPAVGPHGEPFGRSRPRLLLRRLVRHRGALFGSVVLLGVVLMAVGAPVLARYDPIRQDTGLGLAGPGLAHPFGTDEFGRDILSRILFGAQLSLLVAVLSVGISTLAGATVGLISGYFEGWMDQAIMRPMDVLLSFPGLLLALVLAAILGTGLTSVILAVGVAGIPNFARVTRGAVLSARRNEYVEAARCLGCRDHRIMLRHILPNVMAPIIVLSTLYVAFAVLTASSLSFLGVGVVPPTPEWGAMTNAGRHILRLAWWVSTFPGLMIMLLVLSVNLIGDGLRDALDPSLRI